MFRAAKWSFGVRKFKRNDVVVELMKSGAARAPDRGT